MGKKEICTDYYTVIAPFFSFFFFIRKYIITLYIFLDNYRDIFLYIHQSVDIISISVTSLLTSRLLVVTFILCNSRTRFVD